MITATEIIRYLQESYTVDIVESDFNYFMFYDPDGLLPADHRFPFITIVSNDLYDQASDLARPDVYRLNIGISKETFSDLFPAYKGSSYDYTVLDQILPHPVYGMMYWCCVLSPGKETFEKVKPLIAEAYQSAEGLYPKRNKKVLPNNDPNKNWRLQNSVPEDHPDA